MIFESFIVKFIGPIVTPAIGSPKQNSNVVAIYLTLQQ